MHGSSQQFFDGAEFTMMEFCHVFVHVEAINWRTNTVKKGGVKVVDRAVFYMGVLTGLKTSAGVPEQHKGPV